MEWLDIIVRLGAAILLGGVIGLDRNLSHKPTGVRTLGLVAVGAALAVIATLWRSSWLSGQGRRARPTARLSAAAGGAARLS